MTSVNDDMAHIKLTFVKVIQQVAPWFAFGIAVYHYATIYFPVKNVSVFYLYHLFFLLIYFLILNLADALSKDQPNLKERGLIWIISLLILIAVACFAYIRFHAVRLDFQAPYLNNSDFLIGLLLLLGVLVATSIAWGFIIPIFAIAAVFYFFLGHLLTGVFKHEIYSRGYIISQLGMNLANGTFYFIPLSADAIFLIILFGYLLRLTKVISVLACIGQAIGNFLQGGIAYGCVIGSALVGMVTGQAAINVVLTGSMTIPAMKDAGFKPEYAGAIESVASSSSQIMPPILGLGGFIMAMFIGIPYISIAGMAMLPALLFVFSVAVGVFFLIKSKGIRPPKEPIDWGRILRQIPLFLVPLGVLIFLLVYRYSVNFATLYATLILLVMTCLSKSTRPSWHEFLMCIKDGVVFASQMMLVVASIGVFTQVIITTGLGIRTTESLGALNLPLAVILIAGMLVCIFYGMGLPTPAAYTLGAITVVPFMVDVGVPLIPAHFFVFYFCVASGLTPPVAVACLVGSKMAKAQFLPTCVEAIRLALVFFILPYIFIAAPDILVHPLGGGPVLLLMVVVFMLSSICLAAALYNYFLGRLKFFERLLFFLASTSGFGYIIQRVDALLALTALLLTISALLRFRAYSTRISSETPT